jgi:hypothetical protein
MPRFACKILIVIIYVVLILGVFAPVTDHTVAKSLLASDVEPGMLPKEPALKPVPRDASYRALSD